MRTILTVVLVTLVALGASSIAFAQDKATPEEVIAKVRQAAAALSKSGDLEQFKQQQGPWVWKDTYVFVLDCDKKVECEVSAAPGHASDGSQGCTRQTALWRSGSFLRGGEKARGYLD